ncbi:unnamed protein product [Ectocarpus sp. 12 AP-2014]
MEPQSADTDGIRNVRDVESSAGGLGSPLRGRPLFGTQGSPETALGQDENSAEEYGEDDVVPEKLSATMVEVQDLDDEMESDVRVLEGVESMGNATGSIGENQEARSAMVSMTVDRQMSQIRDADDVGDKVDAAVEGLFREHFPWLLDLWVGVKSLAPTRSMIATLWASLADTQSTLRKGKRSKKEASDFTLDRFAKWPQELKAWIDHEDIQKVARTSGRNTEQISHHLCGIINLVDEELYDVFVAKIKEAKMIMLPGEESEGVGAPGEDEGGGDGQPDGGGSETEDHEFLNEFLNRPVFLSGESTSEGIGEPGGGDSETDDDFLNRSVFLPGEPSSEGIGEPGGDGLETEDDEFLNRPVFLPGESTSGGIAEQPLPMRGGMISGQEIKSYELVPECT